MSGLGWQDATAFAIVAVALSILVRARLRRRARPTPLCGDCPSCAPGEETDARSDPKDAARPISVTRLRGRP